MPLSLPVRNTIAGLSLVGFVSSVYFYSISAVKQEDFSDVEAEIASERARRAQALEAAKESQQK